MCTMLGFLLNASLGDGALMCFLPGFGSRFAHVHSAGLQVMVRSCAFCRALGDGALMCGLLGSFLNASFVDGARMCIQVGFG